MLFISRFFLRPSTSAIFLGVFLAVTSFANGKDLKTLDERRKEVRPGRGQFLARSRESQRRAPAVPTALQP